jgi:hypothetical protein
MRHALAVTALLAIGPLVQAADPELIPLRPTPATSAVVVPVENMSYVRTSMYARWQYYAVDQQGYFRPRVVLDFPEPYYLVNGRPYPLLPVLPRNYITYIFD